MAEDYPAIVETFKVVGRLVMGVGDSNDTDQKPEIIPVAGVSVTFTPSLVPAVFKIPGANPPMTVHQEPIRATTDNDGYLVVAADPTKKGVILPWGGSAAIVPTGWTWVITIAAVAGNYPAKTVIVYGSPDAVLDLATLIPVPANPGAEVLEWMKIRDEVKMGVKEYIVQADGYADAYGELILAQDATRAVYLKRRLLGNLDLKLAPGIAGKAYSFTLKLQQDDVGSRTVRLINIKTSQKLAIPLTKTPYAVDIIRFEWDGTDWTAFLAAVDLGIPSSYVQ